MADVRPSSSKGIPKSTSSLNSDVGQIMCSASSSKVRGFSPSLSRSGVMSEKSKSIRVFALGCCISTARLFRCCLCHGSSRMHEVRLVHPLDPGLPVPPCGLQFHNLALKLRDDEGMRLMAPSSVDHVDLFCLHTLERNTESTTFIVAYVDAA